MENIEEKINDKANIIFESLIEELKGAKGQGAVKYINNRIICIREESAKHNDAATMKALDKVSNMAANYDFY